MMARAAFTLLEVLVGIAILALAAVVLGAAYTNTLQAQHAVGRPDAGSEAWPYLSAVILTETTRETLEEGGEMELPDGRRLRWAAQIEAMPVPDLYRVSLTGRHFDTGREFERRLMLLRPTWSAPIERDKLREEWNRLQAAEER
ncbi:MAG: prepilin-type N-terminal cleavage/methylation domain-containing protein [Opitutaceae bacterium]|nr:prepilin-type N-terminal cleavage/methylation domain-containing protein [Opitutaceae bacterium]